MMGYTNGYGYAGYGHHLFGSIIMLLVWVAVIIFIISLVRRMRGPHHRGPFGMHMDKTPLDILKERYAKGEIQKAEFEEKKKDLS